MTSPPVRPARPDDVGAICDLFARAFGRPLEPAVWQWKLGPRATGIPGLEGVPTVWVATDESDRPICHYGGIPRWIALGDAGRHPAMITVDGMTDPTSRRRGAFTETIRHAHAVWREAGIACVLGLPNERWGSRIEALDWRYLYPLRWFLRPLASAALIAQRFGQHRPATPAAGGSGLLDRAYERLLVRSPPADPGIEVGPTAAVDPRFDAVDPRRRAADGGGPDGGCGLLRGADWVGWRYLDCAAHDYEVLEATVDDRLLGYLAWRQDTSGDLAFGTVAELLAEDDRTRWALISAAVRRMRARGAAAAAALAIPGTPEALVLRRAGFRFSRGAFDVRCVPLRDDLPWSVLRDGERFTVVGGDFDVA